MPDLITGKGPPTAAHPRGAGAIRGGTAACVGLRLVRLVRSSLRRRVAIAGILTSRR